MNVHTFFFIGEDLKSISIFTSKYRTHYIKYKTIAANVVRKKRNCKKKNNFFVFN